MGVDPAVRSATEEFLKTRLDTDMPPIPTGHPAKQHNPLEIDKVFIDVGFENVSVIPFHYHAATPCLDKQLEASFRSESMKV
jgi:hypothetical protein